MFKIVKTLFLVALIFNTASLSFAQNLPTLSNEILKLIKNKEPQWKFIPSEVKQSLRSGFRQFEWRFKDKKVYVSINELASSQEAAKDNKNYPHDGKPSVPNLGDESYLIEDLGYDASIDFIRERFRIYVRANSSENVFKFAKYIDEKIQTSKFVDKWAPGDTVVVEYTVEGFIKNGRATNILETVDNGRRGSAGSGSAACEGCETSSEYNYSNYLKILKIEKKRVFLKFYFEMEKSITNLKSNTKIILKAGKWEKEFSISRKGITEKNLGKGLKIKAYIE